MNNIRPAIIALIQWYMDKTLIEGCLLKIKSDDSFNDLITKLVSVFQDEELDSELYTDKFHTQNWFFRRDNIINLWHYDITAVFKYIASFWFYVEHNSMDRITINTDKWLFFLPNKPLHLYNELEEAELLNILLQIK